MNKSELVQQLGNPADPKSEAVQKEVQSYLDEVNRGLASFESIKYFRIAPEEFSVDNGLIAEALRGGDKVQITGFGSFEAKHREARTGRNPRTGKEIKIAASRSPAFRSGKGFKDALGRGKS